jgi:integrase
VPPSVKNGAVERLALIGRISMRQTGKATKYKGIEQLESNKFRVRAKVKDPRTGKPREVDRIVEGPGRTILDAVKQRATWIEEIKSGGAVGERTRVTFSACAQSFIEAKRLSLEPKTIEVYVQSLNAFGELADVYLDAITSSDIQAAIKRMVDKGHVASTIRCRLTHLRSVFRFAMRQSPPVLDRDPSLPVALPKVMKVDDDDKLNKLSAAELARALRVAEERFPEWHAMFLLLACTGIRFTHVSALKWEDIDFDAGVIRFRRKQVEGVVGNITAIKRCPRQLPLRDAQKPELRVLEHALQAHRKRLVAAQHPGLAAGWCFPSEAGTCDTYRPALAAWRSVQERAGVANVTTLHALRHTFNNLTRHQGIDPLVIRSLTQHTSEAQREHYSAVALSEKANAMNGVLRLVRGGDSGGDSAVGGAGQ